MRKSLLCAATLSLMLLGCGSTEKVNTEKGVYSAAVALTAADQVAIQYVVLPLCGPTHPKPLCSEAAVSAQIRFPVIPHLWLLLMRRSLRWSPLHPRHKELHSCLSHCFRLSCSSFKLVSP